MRKLLLMSLIFLARCHSSNPETAWEQFRQALLSGDWETVWDLLSEDSRRHYAVMGSSAKQLLNETLDTRNPETKKFIEETSRRIEETSPRELFLQLMRSIEPRLGELKKGLIGSTVLDYEVTGDSAKILILKSNGSRERYCLTKEQGRWCVDWNFFGH